MTEVRRNGLVIGSSDGIGRQLVERLLAVGWTITGVSRSASERISEAHEHHVLDVRSPGYREALGALCERRGPFDAAVYCAGVGELLVLDALGEQRAAFEVNLLGAIDTFEVLAPAWRAARRGHFVVLSSLADKLLGPQSPGYNASKAAVTSYFESVALAVRKHGIAISNLRFGFVDTKMAKGRVRPFMMSRDRAVREIERALVKRPIRCSAPWSMAMLCAGLGSIMQWRVLLG